MGAEIKMIAPGIQVRYGVKGNTIRYFAFVGGKRYAAPCTLRMDWELLVNGRTHKPTKLLRDDYAAWAANIDTGAEAIKYGLRTPSCKELIDAYVQIALERSHNPAYQKPGEKAIYTAQNHFGHCVQESGLTMGDDCDKLLNTDTITEIFESFCKRMEPISAWSKIMALKSVTAYWTELKYRKMGYKVPKDVRLPDKPKTAEAPQYQMMTPERREKIEAFYLKLPTLKDQWLYLAASMMIEFAMRPIDVAALTADNFVDDRTDPNGFKHLRYQPHKTRGTSGRWVDWPIKPAHWEQIRSIAGERLDAGKTLLPCQRTTFDKLNMLMRVACDMEDEAKCCYELRKFCIDTVYRTMGPQAAVAISGDRIETIMKYYSDPYKIIVEKPIEVLPLGTIKESVA